MDHGCGRWLSAWMWLLLAVTGVSQAEPKQEPVLRFYLDADMSNNSASGHSIEQGIRTALAQHDDRFGDYRLELVVTDHRGSTPRSRRNLERYRDDPRAIALFSGLHSPPLLANRDFINEAEILVLDPWAAAAPITRPSQPPNWIFRLSVDDAKAGYVISRAAVGEGFRRPFLLLEKTGWGRSNQATMGRALEQLGVESAGTAWFNWGLDQFRARTLLRQVQQTGADVIFLVANSPESITLVQAMLSLPVEERLPLRSHWGLTGGSFTEVIDAEQRQGIDLKFVQTRFSIVQQQLEPRVAQVLANAYQRFPDEIRSADDIRAPAGFVHAHDLTRILLSALAQIELSGELAQDRRALRDALEQLQQPVEGMIKRYHPPFRPYSAEDADAHEALGEQDLVMAYFDELGRILLEP